MKSTKSVGVENKAIGLPSKVGKVVTALEVHNINVDQISVEVENLYIIETGNF